MRLDSVPFHIDLPKLLERLRVPGGDERVAEVEQLAQQAQAIGRPKAVCRVVFVDEKGEDYVVLGGVKLASRVLRVNMAQAHRAVAFVATCGTELGQWAAGIDGMLERYYADAINELALVAALHALDAHITERINPGPTSTMNPGSLTDWPIDQQRPLFDILGDVEAAIGVRLTESWLMLPNKSVSGLRFATEVRFESCQLCPREGCPGRRAKYDERLYDERYGLAAPNDPNEGLV